METAELVKKLKSKRKDIAQREGKELYMVFSNQTLKDTAKERPETKKDLLNIKGWGDVKVKKYGDEILKIIKNQSSSSDSNQQSLLGEALDASVDKGEKNEEEDESHVYSVGSYLEFINIGLRKSEARVKGEITSFNPRKGDSYLFFTVTDQDDGSVMNCFMWKNDYDISGVDLEEGMEVIIEGYPKIHTPTGRFSFQTSMVELSGEGALKKAYEELKKKLKKEGVFSDKRKRPLPKFPKNIGVITSLKGGTVIHDFQSNLSKFGFTIKGIDARVEGKKAVKSLLGALDKARNLDIDVLVIIRGGGSIESLQAFDNEKLVREIVDFPVPVIAGIGHHEDVTLSALAADNMESTPQGVAEMINRPWEEARAALRVFRNSILSKYENMLANSKHDVSLFSKRLQEGFSSILNRFKNAYSSFKEKMSSLEYVIEATMKDLGTASNSLIVGMDLMIEKAKEKIKSSDKRLEINNPKRQLKLGYSIVSKEGNIIRKVKQVSKGDEVDIRVSDGKIRSEVSKTDKNN